MSSCSTASSLRNTPTTWVRRLVDLLTRLSEFAGQTFCQWWRGNDA